MQYTRSLMHLFIKRRQPRLKRAYRNVPFPKLRYMHVEGTYFYGAFRPKPVLIDILLDRLTERCERNAQVQVLRLDNCYYFVR